MFELTMDRCRFDTGLVPTAPLLAVLQWGGRTHFVLAVVRQIPQVRFLDGLGTIDGFNFAWFHLLKLNLGLSVQFTFGNCRFRAVPLFS